MGFLSERLLLLLVYSAGYGLAGAEAIACAVLPPMRHGAMRAADGSPMASGQAACAEIRLTEKFNKRIKILQAHIAAGCNCDIIPRLPLDASRTRRRRPQIVAAGFMHVA
jgi:hypothetical protein